MKCFLLSSAFLLSLAFFESSLCDFLSDTASPLSENASSEFDLGVYKVTEELSKENEEVLPDDRTDGLENFETQNLSDEVMLQDGTHNNESEVSDTATEETIGTEVLEENTDTNETDHSGSDAAAVSTAASEVVESSPTTITTQAVPAVEIEAALNEIDAESSTQIVSDTESTTADTESAVSDEVEKEEVRTEPADPSSSTTTVEPVTVSNVSSKCKNRTETGNTTNTLFGDRNISVETALEQVEKGLSNQIRKILQHYQKAGVVVIPGRQLLPDPLDMPNTKYSIPFGSMVFTNMRVYGLSNFTVEHVNTDIDKMQVYVLLNMKRLVILGNYTMNTFLKRAAGPFNVTLLNVDSEGAAEIKPDSDGQLQATDSEMDMYAHDMKMDFKNLGGSMFQGMVSGIGSFLFDSMKPAIIEKVNAIIRNDVNAKIKEMSKKYVTNVAPVDLALAEGRKYVKEKGYDPYHIRDYSLKEGDYGLNITHFVLNGLSTFYRVGNVSLAMDSGVIQIALHVATEELTGECEWSVKLGRFYSREGYANFTIDHMQARFSVNQSLDVCKHPVLENLDIELGRVRLKMDGKQPLDVVLEYVVNTLPTLIRHVIVDAMEIPIKYKIQEILNSIDVEKLVDENLPLLDNLGV